MLIWIFFVLSWSLASGQPTCNNLVSNCINCTHVNYYCPEENVEYIIACPKLTYCKEHYYTICTSIKPERCKNGKPTHDVRPSSHYKSVLSSSVSNNKNCQIEIPECQDTGRFVVPGSECQKYILCVKHTQGFTSRIFDCPPNSLFNPVKQRCSPVYRCHEVCSAGPKKKHRVYNPVSETPTLVTEKTVQYTETNHTLRISKITVNTSFTAPESNNTSVSSEESSSSSTSSSENVDCMEYNKYQHPTKCIGEGTFPVKGTQCKNYVECYEEEIGFTQIENICDDDMTFNPISKQCSMTYICPNCINPDEHSNEYLDKALTSPIPYVVYTTTEDSSNTMITNDIADIIKDCVNLRTRKHVDYTCGENKRFPVLGTNCIRYIECVKKGSKYDLVQLKCPKNKNFDPVAGECNFYYVCPVCPENSSSEEDEGSDSSIGSTTSPTNVGDNETFEVVNASSTIHSNKTTVSKTLVFSLAATNIKPITGKLTTSTTSKGPLVVAKEIQSSIKGFNWTVAVNGSLLSKLMLQNHISDEPEIPDIVDKKTTRSIVIDHTIMIDCLEYPNKSSIVPQCINNAVYALKGTQCKQFVKCKSVEGGFNLEVVTCSGKQNFNPFSQKCSLSYNCPHCVKKNVTSLTISESSDNVTTTEKPPNSVPNTTEMLLKNITEKTTVQQTTPSLDAYALFDLIEHVIPDVENHSTRKRDTLSTGRIATGSTIFYRPSTSKILSKSPSKFLTGHAHPPRMALSVDCMEYDEGLYVSKCFTEGIFALKGSKCRKFIECVEGKNGFDKIEQSCDESSLFNPYTKQCSFSYVCPNCGNKQISSYIKDKVNTTTLQMEQTTEKAYLSEVLKDCISLNLERRVKYSCMKNRTNAALGTNCTRYVKCVKKRNKLALLELRCPKNELFDPYAEKCSKTYFCPDCADVSKAVYLTTEPSAVHSFSKRETIFDTEVDTTTFTPSTLLHITTQSLGISSSDRNFNGLSSEIPIELKATPSENQSKIRAYMMTTAHSVESSHQTTIDCMDNSSKSPGDYKCKDNGVFALIGSHCKQYVKCRQELLGFNKEVLTCAHNQHFDPHKKLCTFTYGCPLCTAQETGLSHHDKHKNINLDTHNPLTTVSKRHSFPPRYTTRSQRLNFLEHVNHLTKNKHTAKNRHNSARKSHGHSYTPHHSIKNSPETPVSVDCLENSKFEQNPKCTTTGIFAIKGSECRKYMECSTGLNGIIKREYTCMHKMHFNPHTSQCSSSYVCPSCNDMFSTETSVSSTIENFSEKAIVLDELEDKSTPMPQNITNSLRDCVPLNSEEQDYKCTVVGTKPVLGSNCTRYLRCVKKKSKLALLELKCPTAEYFDPGLGQCSPTYTCPSCSEVSTETYGTIFDVSSSTDSGSSSSTSLTSSTASSSSEPSTTFDSIKLESSTDAHIDAISSTLTTKTIVPSTSSTSISSLQSTSEHITTEKSTAKPVLKHQSTPRVIYRSVVTKRFNSRASSKKPSKNRFDMDRVRSTYGHRSTTRTHPSTVRHNSSDIIIDCVNPAKRIPIEPECSSSGVFAVRGSYCKQFVKCIADQSGYRTVVSACPENQRFQPQTRSCTSTYECPLCSPYVINPPRNATVPAAMEVETFLRTAGDKEPNSGTFRAAINRNISKRKTTLFIKDPPVTQGFKYYDMITQSTPYKAVKHRNRVFSVRRSHLSTTTMKFYGTTQPETTTMDSLTEPISATSRNDPFSTQNRYFTPRPRKPKMEKSSGYYEKPVRHNQNNQKPGFKTLALSTAARRFKPRERYSNTKRPGIKRPSTSNRYKPLNARLKTKFMVEDPHKITTEHQETITSTTSTTSTSTTTPTTTTTTTTTTISPLMEDLQNEIIDCLGTLTTVSRVFQCNDNGIFAVKGSECKQFIKCNKTTLGYSMEVTTCPDNQNFDPSIQLCTTNYECPQCNAIFDEVYGNDTMSDEVQELAEVTTYKASGFSYPTPHEIKIIPRTDIVQNSRQKMNLGMEGRAFLDLISRINPRHSTSKRDISDTNISVASAATESLLTKKQPKNSKLKRPVDVAKKAVKPQEPMLSFKKPVAAKKLPGNESAAQTGGINQHPIVLSSNIDCLEYSKYHENVIKCESEGTFSVKGSECKKYIICYEEKMGFTRIERTCPKKTKFNPITQQCSATYICPKCGEQDIIETYTVTKSPTLSTSAFRRLNSVTGSSIIASTTRSSPPVSFQQQPLSKGTLSISALDKHLAKYLMTETTTSRPYTARTGFNDEFNKFIKEDGSEIIIDCVNTSFKNPSVPLCKGKGLFVVTGSHCTQYVNCTEDHFGFHIEVLTCPQNQYFHPILKTCTYLYECPYCLSDDFDDTLNVYTASMHEPIDATKGGFTLAAINRLNGISNSTVQLTPSTLIKRGNPFFTVTKYGQDREKHTTMKRSATGYETYVFPTANRRPPNVMAKQLKSNPQVSPYMSARTSSSPSAYNPLNRYFASDLMTKILKAPSTHKIAPTPRPSTREPLTTTTSTPKFRGNEIVIDCIDTEYRNPRIPQCTENGVYAVRGSHCKQFVECTKDDEGFQIKVTSCPEKHYFHPYFKWCLYTYKCPACSAVTRAVNNKSSHEKEEYVESITDVYETFINDSSNNEEEESSEDFDSDSSSLEGSLEKESPNTITVDCLDTNIQYPISPRCVQPGTFALKGSNCKQYYRCIRSKSGFTVDIQICPGKQFFNPQIQKCTRFYECKPCEPESITEQSVEVEMKWTKLNFPTDEPVGYYSTVRHTGTKAGYISAVNKSESMNSDDSSEFSDEYWTEETLTERPYSTKQGFTPYTRGYPFYGMSRYMSPATETHSTLKRAIETSDSYLSPIKRKYVSSVADRYIISSSDGRMLPESLVHSENPEIARLAYDVSRLRSLVLAILAKTSNDDNNDEVPITRKMLTQKRKTTTPLIEEIPTTAMPTTSKPKVVKCDPKRKAKGCPSLSKKDKLFTTVRRLTPTTEKCKPYGSKKDSSTVIKCTITNRTSPKRKSNRIRPSTRKMKHQNKRTSTRRKPGYTLKKRFTSVKTPKNKRVTSKMPKVIITHGPFLDYNQDYTENKKSSKSNGKSSTPYFNDEDLYDRNLFDSNRKRSTLKKKKKYRSTTPYTPSSGRTYLRTVSDLENEIQSTNNNFTTLDKRSTDVEHVTSPTINKYSVFNLSAKSRQDTPKPDNVFTFPLEHYFMSTPKNRTTTPLKTRMSGVGNYLVTTIRSQVKLEIGPTSFDGSRYGTFFVSFPRKEHKSKVTRKRSTDGKKDESKDTYHTTPMNKEFHTEPARSKSGSLTTERLGKVGTTVATSTFKPPKIQNFTGTTRKPTVSNENKNFDSYSDSATDRYVPRLDKKQSTAFTRYEKAATKELNLTTIKPTIPQPSQKSSIPESTSSTVSSTTASKRYLEEPGVRKGQRYGPSSTTEGMQKMSKTLPTTNKPDSTTDKHVSTIGSTLRNNEATNEKMVTTTTLKVASGDSYLTTVLPAGNQRTSTFNSNENSGKKSATENPTSATRRPGSKSQTLTTSKSVGNKLKIDMNLTQATTTDYDRNNDVSTATNKKSSSAPTTEKSGTTTGKYQRTTLKATVTTRENKNLYDDDDYSPPDVRVASSTSRQQKSKERFQITTKKYVTTSLPRVTTESSAVLDDYSDDSSTNKAVSMTTIESKLISEKSVTNLPYTKIPRTTTKPTVDTAKVVSSDDYSPPVIKRPRTTTRRSSLFTTLPTTTLRSRRPTHDEITTSDTTTTIDPAPMRRTIPPEKIVTMATSTDEILSTAVKKRSTITEKTTCHEMEDEQLPRLPAQKQMKVRKKTQSFLPKHTTKREPITKKRPESKTDQKQLNDKYLSTPIRKRSSASYKKSTISSTKSTEMLKDKYLSTSINKRFSTNYRKSSVSESKSTENFNDEYLSTAVKKQSSTVGNKTTVTPRITKKSSRKSKPKTTKQMKSNFSITNSDTTEEVTESLTYEVATKKTKHRFSSKYGDNKKSVRYSTRQQPMATVEKRTTPSAEEYIIYTTKKTVTAKPRLLSAVKTQITEVLREFLVPKKKQPKKQNKKQTAVSSKIDSTPEYDDFPTSAKEQLTSFLKSKKNPNRFFTSTTRKRATITGRRKNNFLTTITKKKTPSVTTIDNYLSTVIFKNADILKLLKRLNVSIPAIKDDLDKIKQDSIVYEVGITKETKPTLSNKKSTPCKRNGTVPLQNTKCQGYIRCIVTNTKVKEQIYYCPKNKLFDPVKRKCTRQYRCRDCYNNRCNPPSTAGKKSTRCPTATTEDKLTRFPILRGIYPNCEKNPGTRSTESKLSTYPRGIGTADSTNQTTPNAESTSASSDTTAITTPITTTTIPTTTTTSPTTTTPSTTSTTSTISSSEESSITSITNTSTTSSNMTTSGLSTPCSTVSSALSTPSRTTPTTATTTTSPISYHSETTNMMLRTQWKAMDSRDKMMVSMCIHNLCGNLKVCDISRCLRD